MNSKKYLINIILIVLFGGGAIYFSIGGDIRSSLMALSKADIGWITICLLLMSLYYLFDGTILYFFAKLYQRNFTFKQGLKNALSGMFWCGITPFSSGGQFAQVYIFNKQGVEPTHSASILLMAFIVYQSILVLYTGFIMIVKFAYYNAVYSGFFSLAIIGFIVNVMVILGLFLGAKSKAIQNFFCVTIVRLLYKIRMVKEYEKVKCKVEKNLHNFRKELHSLQKNKRILIQTIILNILKLTIIYSIPFFVTMALQIEVSIGQLFDFIGICSFVYMITAFIPIPGASGGSEGIYLLLFTPFIGSATPITLLLWRCITYYLGLIIGGLVFALDREINLRR